METMYIYIIGGVLVAVLLIYLSQRNSKDIDEQELENDEDEFLEEDLDDDFMNEVDFSRRLHYNFAHTIVRDELFRNPDAFINLVLTENMHNMWNNAQKYYREQYGEVSEPIEDEELSVHACMSGGFGFIVIQMPRPKQMTEVYFIGIIMDGEANNYVSQYLTLEYGEDENKAVQCGWTEDGMHLNYGDSATLTIDEFKVYLLKKENQRWGKGMDKWRQLE